MLAIPNVLRSYLLPLFQNWVLASRSSNFETSRPICPKIIFHSVQLLLLMTASYFLITSTSFLIRFLTYSSPSCKEEIKATVRLLSSCWDRNKTLNYCAIQVLKLGYTGVPIINANNNENCSLLLKKYTADSNPLVSPISNLNIKLNYAVQFSFRSLANNLTFSENSGSLTFANSPSCFISSGMSGLSNVFVRFTSVWHTPYSKEPSLAW